MFPSVESFLQAFHNGTLKRQANPPDRTEDVSWSTRKRRGSQLDLDHLPGPRSVSFAGLRFRVDKELQYISWMGWGLFLGFNRDMGVSLWDVRFRGERIIYEVTLASYQIFVISPAFSPVVTSRSYVTIWYCTFSLSRGR